MPIYEYRCKSCGEIEEFLVGTSERDEEIVCKNCGNNELEKIMSVAAISIGTKNSPVETCCGQEEQCETPSCSTGNACPYSSGSFED